MRNNWRISLGIWVLVLGITILVGGLVGPETKPVIDMPDLDFFPDEVSDGRYFTVEDENGRELDKTARFVYVGDEFITQDNYHYRVKRVDDRRAVAELLGRVDLVSATEDVQPVWSLVSSKLLPVQNQPRNLLAVYNTHSAESYVPTDGSDSIPGGGGIFKVGDVFTAKLQELGVDVAYDKTPHEPHDANAYKRSRRTAIQLLSRGPAAIIDIHRDGVPDPDFYTAKISNRDATQIRLVVGRQNQNMQANLDFAKRIKAQADQIHPGLIKGIFMARGNYNQDLSPRSILIEVGTHTNKREMAQEGAALFADVITQVMGLGGRAGVTPGGPGPVGATRIGGDWFGVLWVLGILLVGGGAFLLISTGSWQGAVDKLRQFSTKEWANALRRRKGDKKPDNQ